MYAELLNAELEKSCKSVFVDDGMLFVKSKQDNIECFYGKPISQTLQIGCFSKIILSSIIINYFIRNKELLYTPIKDLKLKCDFGLGDETSLIHLLSETHGIDESYTNITYKSFIKNINDKKLLKLYPPGLFHQTGIYGHYLASIIFEEITNIPLLKHIDLFSKEHNILLNTSLFKNFSPSVGGKDFQYPLNDILKFLTWYFSIKGKKVFSILSEKVVPYRNWSFDFFDACIGFTHYGDNWYGGNSSSGEGSLIFRFNQILETVIIVYSSSKYAYRIYGALFSNNLFELRSNRAFPQLLKKFSISDFVKYIGIYENSRFIYEVSLNENEILLNTRNKEDDAYKDYSLIPCSNDIFFTSPSTTSFSFIEFHFIVNNHNNIYIWDGENVMSFISP